MSGDTVGLTDIAAGLPGLLKDAPTTMRGVLTGLPTHRSAKRSIGKVFADRAARYGDRVFIKFETTRFNISRVFEFYGVSGGNTGFVNVFNIPKTAEIGPTPVAFVEDDSETGEPVRNKKGRVRKVRGGKPGMLLSKVSTIQPFEGYTEAEATEKKLVRNAFRDGDVWLNTGDLMRPQGWRHAAFVDRLGDTFRWKGENVATTTSRRPCRKTGPSKPSRSSGCRCLAPTGARGWRPWS